MPDARHPSDLEARYRKQVDAKTPQFLQTPNCVSNAAGQEKCK